MNMDTEWIGVLNADTIQEEWVYERLFCMDDEAQQARAEQLLRDRAAALRRKTVVNRLLKVYANRFLEEPTAVPKPKADRVTMFSECPYPQMRCGRWEAGDDGITCAGDTACSHPIIPVERLYNIETNTEKIKLAFYRDGQWKTVVADAGVVSSQTAVVSLAARGVIVNSATAKHLIRYIGDILSMNRIPLIRSISRLGWVDNDFVPYCGKYIYDGDDDYRSTFEAVREHGTAEVWKAYAHDCCVFSGICRLILAASCASALVKPLRINSFVVHLWGGTGVGKTVALMMAASVWGDPSQGALLQSLNATKVGLERKMGFLHDIPLFGDELQIIKDKFDNYDQLIMFLTEGSGRNRGTASGGIERTLTWSNLLLSTGEEPITQSTSGGGARNRCVEIQCENPIFSDGHQAASVFRDHYGFLGKEFLKAMDDGRLTQSYDGYYAEMVKKDTTEKQAMAMAAILTADQYMAEILGLDPVDIDAMARHMTKASEVDVTARAYEWVCNWIAEHNENFQRGSLLSWGRIDDTCVMINRNVLDREMNEAGFSLNSCLSSWAEKGLIIKSPDGRYRHKSTVNGVRADCIKITKQKITGEGVSDG